MDFHVLHIENGVHFLSKEEEFDQFYLKARELEGRMLDDSMVANLPHLSPDHPLANEWAKRIDTLNRVLPYFQANKVNSVLDIGCGNGWFTNQLHTLTGAKALGLDINKAELEQAERIFSDTEIRFCYGNLFEDILPGQQFELITLNACIQYFPDLKRVFHRLFELLHPNGEIHVIDSQFYPASEIDNAKQRSVDYYTQLGVPEMGLHYHHHSLEKLAFFQPNFHYRPGRLKKWLNKHSSPFPWISLKKGGSNRI